VLSDAIADTPPYLGYETVQHINKTLGIQQLSLHIRLKRTIGGKYRKSGKGITYVAELN